METFREHRALWIILIAIIGIALIIVGYLTFLSNDIPNNSPPVDQNPATILQGNYVCLPLANGTKAPDCKPAIKVGEEYYALDLATVREGGATTTFTQNTPILAAGNVTPIEAISSDEWKKYRVKGIMKVDEIAKQ